ncbi:MAG: hypothetical protein H6566_04680 [Lewinellaceae bacterium]|nr:hypothetical protein [Lewinellaceae bacterium]
MGNLQNDFGRRSSYLFLFLLAVCLSVLVAVVPDILSPGIESWSKNNLGQYYRLILAGMLFLGFAIIIYITPKLSAFQPGGQKRRWSGLTIPWSPENEKLVQDAKEAVRKSELEEALDCLFKIDIPELNDETTLLAGRLAQHERENRHGIQSPQSATTEANRIRKDILSLITAVEKSLKEEGEINTKIKVYLTKRYQNRLDQKLAGRQPINLSKILSKEGTSEETVFITLSHDKIQGAIQNIFEEAKGRLLITGIPGSGKTVLMLQLVLALLKERTGAIPVILNLATWQSSYIKLDAWLEEILPAELGVNSALAKKVMQDIPLILLLDGLDEVKEADRKSCLGAIGRYGADAQRQFVIASRKQEYVELKKDAPVYLQVEVEPLKLSQIETELKRVGYQQPEATPLLKAIETDATLREVVKTPFYFNVLQLLFAQGNRLSDLEFQSNDLTERQKEVVEDFLITQLASAEEKWSRKNVEHWLSFLASRMNQKNIVVFELRDLQYGWWKWSARDLVLGGFCKGLVIGLYIGLVVGLYVGLVGGLYVGLFTSKVGVLSGVLVYGLVNGLFSGLVGALAGGLVGGLIVKPDWGLRRINTKVNVTCKKGKYFQWLGRDLVHGLIYCLVGGLIYGLVIGLFSSLVHVLFIGLFKGLFRGLLWGLVDGLYAGLYVGLSGGLFISLVRILVIRNWRRKSYFATKDEINLTSGSFLLFIKNYLGYGLIYGLVGGLVGGFIFGLSKIMVDNMITGLFVGLIGGLFKGLIDGPIVKFGKGQPYIETKEVATWTWKNFALSVKKNLVEGLVVGLIGALLGGLIGALVGGLVKGILGGILGGLSSALVALFHNKYSSFIQINTPYQRFKASIRSLHFSILQHWLLRYQFYRKSLLPFRLVNFLNEMTKRHMLESDGATWRFRHRIIQDYFAELWEMDN